MQLGYAPRSSQKSSHDSTSTDSAEFSARSGGDQQDTLGNQFLAAARIPGALMHDLSTGVGALQNEGWRAVFDMSAAVSREQGREALADKLVVLKPGEQGTGAPNEVDEQTYERLVCQYGAIRNGDSMLQIDTSRMDMFEAAGFESGVMGDISRMMQTPTGRALINELSSTENGHTTQISSTDKALGPNVDGDWVAADKDLTTNPTSSAEMGALLSNGSGTSMRIRYQPGQDVDGGDASWGHARSDTVLAQQMALALHGIRGDMPCNEDGLDADGAARQAIGLGDWANELLTENRYRADRSILADLPGALESDSESYYRDTVKPGVI